MENGKKNKDKDKSNQSTTFINYINNQNPSRNQNIRYYIYNYINQANKNTIKHIYNSLTNIKAHNDIMCLIRDLINFKLYKPIKPKKEKTPRCMIYIPYANKAMEYFKLNKVFYKYKNEWPLDINNYKTIYHSPLITYTYDKPIRNIICNYKQVIDNYNYNLPVCNCHAYNTTIDQFHGHIVTANMNIMKNAELRNIINKGTNYRLRKHFNPSSCVDNIKDSITKYIEYICKKLKKNSSSFDNWKNIILREIENVSVNLIIKDKGDEIISSRAKEYLDKIHNDMVITTCDKANKNFAIICKHFYLKTLLHEVNNATSNNGNKIYEIYAGNTNDIIEHHNDVNKILLNNILDDKNKQLPYIHLLPKFHKNPIKFRTIISSKTCSTKLISKTLGKCLQQIQQTRKSYCQRIYNITNINTYWIINSNDYIGTKHMSTTKPKQKEKMHCHL